MGMPLKVFSSKLISLKLAKIFILSIFLFLGGLEVYISLYEENKDVIIVLRGLLHPILFFILVFLVYRVLFGLKFPKIEVFQDRTTFPYFSSIENFFLLKIPTKNIEIRNSEIKGYFWLFSPKGFVTTLVIETDKSKIRLSVSEYGEENLCELLYLLKLAEAGKDIMHTSKSNHN
jgi:hypothetical protein